VGNEAPTLIWVSTRILSFSASCTRAFQASRLRETRPASMTGLRALDSNAAAWATACCDGSAEDAE
jgi:hypothetical protein